MAIGIELRQTERVLFCASKWWGDPDLPENMQYPVMEVEDNGEIYEYPLTFICQINCEDIAPFDKDGLLPHEGMLYFFGAVDELLGYEAPVPTPIGEWPKGRVVVKYAKSINFETFQSCILVGDEGESLTDKEMEIVFHEDDVERGIRMFGDIEDEVKEKALVNLLQIGEDSVSGFRCENWKSFSFIISESDLKFGNWKRAKGFLAAD